VTTEAVDRWPFDNQPSTRWPIYTRGNVGEVFPDVVTPLGWSLLGLRAEAGWREAYRTLGVTRAADFTQDMEILGVFNGYCYLNASLLRVSGVRAPGGSPEAVDQQLLGDSSAPPYEERRGDKSLWCRVRMLRTVRRLLREEGMPAIALEACDLAARHVQARPSLDAPDESLIEYLGSTFGDDFQKIFAYHINLTTQSSLAASYLAYLCLRAGDLGLMVGLSTDLGGVESAAPGEAMWRISRLVRDDREVSRMFDGGLDGLETRLRSNSAAVDVVAMFDAFLAEHGHRGPNEWELASRTWRTHPEIALAAIDRMRLADDDRGPDSQRERAASLRTDAVAEMLDNLSRIDRRSFHMVIEASGAFARGREMTRNQSIIVVNAAREVAFELARRAHDKGGVEPEAAFMLVWEEFLDYVRSPTMTSHRAVIESRAELSCLLGALDPPFVIADDLMTIPELLARSSKEVTVVPSGTELQGNPGSPGVARGRARVVVDPSEPGDLSVGDILVAPLTDPSWTPLFLAASGVLVDVGATVSHAVVVSRELCIPCVVGVHDATTIIPDGSLIEIDGSTGVVRVLEPPEAEAADPSTTPASTVVGPDVVLISEPLGKSRAETVALLGGKGANLAEMTQQLDLPVPPAFVITTDVCRSHLSGKWPEGLEDRIRTALDELGAQLGQCFGDAQLPFLVAVRSGSPVSMPGMMDTLLNVGINPEVRDALATQTGDATFAAQTWLRFCRMYAEMVLGIDRGEVEAAAVFPADNADSLNAAADRVLAIAAEFGGIPLDPHAQVLGAVTAVFDSWNSPRARIFRDTEGIDHQIGTAVTVQAMVFGNLGDQSGTGVVFTRNPASGHDEPYGDYLPRAQGEDVVAGTHEVHGLDHLAETLPGSFGELLQVCDRLERHYRDMCDIEFTIACGRLYILQTRIGRRSPEAAIRIAVQMADDPDFPLTRAEAVARVDHSMLDTLAAQSVVAANAAPIATGIAASPGVGVGTLSCDPDAAAELAEAGQHVVLARAETSPADVHGMVGAAGLVTSFGGAVSHAAVVARSWGIPAVTGVRSMSLVAGGIEIGGEFVAEGSTVTVDGTGGGLYIGDQLADHDHEVAELDTVRRWAVELGVELGEMAVGHDEVAMAHRDVDEFAVVRTVALKGMGGEDVIASALETDTAAVAEIVASFPQLLESGARGLALTPIGRDWLSTRLAEELTCVDVSAMNELYERFEPLNRRFKMLVTDWQGSDQSKADFDATIEALGQLHGEFIPIVVESELLAGRLRPYPARFDRALDAVRNGDLSMLASPLKDSYHTIWFEYHEELFHFTGRSRRDEERER